MPLPNIEYASRLFDEINTQIRNDSLYYGGGSLEKKLRELPKEKKVDLVSTINELVGIKTAMCSNSRIHIGDKIGFESYFDETVKEGRILDREILGRHDIWSRKGISYDKSYFIQAVGTYNGAVEAEQENKRIREERSTLESGLQEINSVIGSGYKPFLGRDSVKAYQPIPETTAQNFEGLDQEAQKDILSVFTRFMIADRFSGELRNYPNRENYEALKSYFREFQKTI